jgi:hypothetical protein
VYEVLEGNSGQMYQLGWCTGYHSLSVFVMLSW